MLHGTTYKDTSMARHASMRPLTYSTHLRPYFEVLFRLWVPAKGVTVNAPLGYLVYLRSSCGAAESFCWAASLCLGLCSIE